MAALWVIRVDLLSRLTDLLDNNEPLVFLEHPLDFGLDVRRDHDEPISLSEDRFVRLRLELDLLDTARLCPRPSRQALF
jgi:hypothetical protein